MTDESDNLENPFQKMAGDLNKTIKEVYGEAHEFKKTSLQEFPLLDEKFYRQSTAALEKEGYALLGDIEDVTTSRINPKMRTCIRLFTGDDGTISASIYHVNTTGKKTTYFLGMDIPKRVVPTEIHLDVHIVDLETEFSNGHYLITTNNPYIDHLSSPESIHINAVPMSPLKSLLKSHRKKLKEIMNQDASISPNIITSYDGTLKMQSRLEKIKRDYRNSIGLLDEEMEAIGGDEFSDEGKGPHPLANPDYIQKHQKKNLFRRLSAILFLGGGGLLMMIWGAYPTVQSLRSYYWPTGEGTVLQTELREKMKSSDSGDYPVFWARVKYEYHANRVRHISDNIYFRNLDDHYVRDLSQAKADLARFPTGSSVTVYYNPKNATQSLLDREIQFKSIWFAVFGFFIFLAGMLGEFK